MTTQGPGSWRDAWTPIWLCQQDFVDATSTDVVVACTDDTGTGVAEPRTITSLIARCEAKLMSFVIGEYGPPPLNATLLAELQNDPLLAGVALDMGVIMMLRKHPEYVRSAKEQANLDKRMEAAEKEAIRILQARQRPPTVAVTPANVGGSVVDNGSRAFVDSPDGTKNNGDY